MADDTTMKNLFGLDSDDGEHDEVDGDTWVPKEIRAINQAPLGMMAVFKSDNGKYIPLPIVSFAVCLFENATAEMTEIRPFALDIITGDVRDINEFEEELVCITLPGQDPIAVASEMVRALEGTEQS